MKKGLVGIAIGVVFLALVAWRIDWTQVGETLLHAESLWLIPIAIVLTVHYALKGLRWRVLLSSTTDISPLFSIRLTMVGFLMNNIFPARIGELGRPYLLHANRKGVSFAFALATVVGDKLFDLFLVVVCLLLSSVILPMPAYAKNGILVLSGICLAGLAGAVTASRWKGGSGSSKGGGIFRLVPTRFRALVRDALVHFAQGLATVSSVRRALASLALTLAAFAFLACAVYMTLVMVHLEGRVETSLFVIGMIGIGFMIPSAPTNVGNFHFFATQALVMTGIADVDRAFSFALISHISQVAVVTVAGALSLVGLNWKQVWNDRS